jgi:hypothetical protein
MQKLSTYTHGLVDYMTGAALLAAPNIFGFAEHGVAAQIPRIVGLGIIGQSLMTQYELGAVKTIPMRAHLTSDAATGAFLAASPWLFGFANDSPKAWVPYVLVGLSEIAVAAMTDPDSNMVSDDSRLPARLEDTPQQLLNA